MNPLRAYAIAEQLAGLKHKPTSPRFLTDETRLMSIANILIAEGLLAVNHQGYLYKTDLNGNPWTSGEFSTFAAALQKRFGGEIYGVFNHSQKYPNEDRPIHAYCIVDGKAYDANGPHTIEEASDTSGYDLTEMDRQDAVEFVWRKTDKGELFKTHEGYDTKRIPEAVQYIDLHPELFPTPAGSTK